jgi:hypothetical protein
MLSIVAISVSMRDLPVPARDIRRRLQFDSTSDVGSISTVADLKQYLLNRLDYYKNSTTSQ